ncbi:MAG: MotA/TolQ/ExbB proton channel family protein [Gammaproteobacteria bacterium]|nr:MotA/TolQ/ExbB proton channel family protein [Gammaproteobacteria bacterium]
MKSIVDKPFGLLAVFAGLLGVELFVIYLLVDRGLLQTLLAEDYSFISRAILAIYLLASLHVMLVAYYLSVEGRDLLAGARGQVSRSNVQRYFALLRAPSSDGDESGDLLIEVLDGRCRGKFRFGYVIADLMLKLGLLGTVIGFIFMLGSLVDLNSIDITVMQKLLAQMSGGMKVALFTTLAGMSCGVLLNMKYQLLDWSVDNLLDDVREQTYRNKAR